MWCLCSENFENALDVGSHYAAWHRNWLGGSRASIDSMDFEYRHGPSGTESESQALLGVQVGHDYAAESCAMDFDGIAAGLAQRFRKVCDRLFPSCRIDLGWRFECRRSRISSDANAAQGNLFPDEQ